MNNSVAVVTDSVAGISHDKQKEFNNLFILPLRLNLPNGKIIDSVSAISDDQFFTMFKKHQIIKTSQTNPVLIINLWRKLLKNFQYIIHLGIGSHFSGQNQMLNTLLKQEPTWQKRIIVLDSQLLSVPLKLLVLKACRFFLTNGNDVKGFLKLQTEFFDHLEAYALLTDIDFLQASGRIPILITKFLKTTKLIPIATIRGGKIVLYKKKRTVKKAIRFILEKIRNKTDQIIISYSQQMPPPYIPVVRELVAMHHFKRVIWMSMERITLCHTGVSMVQFCGLN